MEPLFSEEIYLDSDDLLDLRLLLDAVMNSEAVLLVQTQEVLLRPYCLAELYTAITHSIPVVCVCVRGGGYNNADATNILTFLDLSLIHI